MDYKRLGIGVNKNYLNNAKIKPEDVEVRIYRFNKETKKGEFIYKTLGSINISDIKYCFKAAEAYFGHKYGVDSLEYNKYYKEAANSYATLKDVYSDEVKKHNYIYNYVNTYRANNNVKQETTEIIPSEKINHNDETKVISTEEGTTLSNNARKNLIAMGVTALAATVIIASLASMDTRKKNTITKTTPSATEIVIDEKPVEEEIVEVQEEVTPVEVVEDVKVNTPTVDYSRVDEFYNQILEYRNKDANFAKYFQSKEDIINFIDCVYKFNPLYNTETSIDSIDLFDEIIIDYYDSCIRCGVEPKLNILFKQDSFIQTKLAEAEKVCYNLKNDLGTDYSIANEYYTFFSKNICDGRTAINQSKVENAPLVETLELMFHRYYKSSSYAQRAAANQQNDVLPIDGKDPYYSVDTGITTNNNFACPNSVKENIIMRIRPNHTEWIDKEENNNEGLNSENVVYIYFDEVLNNSLSR